VAGNQIAEILHADHALEKGLSQITYLTHGGSKQCSEHTQPQGDRIDVFINEEDNNAGDNGGQSAGDAAFHSLFGADMRRNLVLAELHAAKESEAVTYPCGGAGQHQGLPPDVADSDDHDKTEEQAGVIEPGQCIQRAPA